MRRLPLVSEGQRQGNSGKTTALHTPGSFEFASKFSAQLPQLKGDASNLNRIDDQASQNFKHQYVSMDSLKPTLDNLYTDISASRH